jgi:hypothetical protein
MLQQHEYPPADANYKSMNGVQLIAELQRIARFPHLYDNRIERKACIATELALRVQSPTEPTPLLPIIVLESD